MCRDGFRKSQKVSPLFKIPDNLPSVVSTLYIKDCIYRWEKYEHVVFVQEFYWMQNRKVYNAVVLPGKPHICLNSSSIL